MKLKSLNRLKLTHAILLCFSISLIGYGQKIDIEAKKEIDSMSLNIFKHMNNRDYDAIIDMTHPKVFDMVPKETMVSVFKTMLEGNEEFTVDIPEQIPKYKVSDIFVDEENNTDYAFVSYDMKMSMTFHKHEGFDNEAKENMIKMMKLQGMEAQFISNKSLILNMPNRITILLNDESTNNKWAMLNYDPNSPLFFQLLSVSIIEKAKQHHQNLLLENKKK